MRSAVTAVLGANDVLPSALGQEPVIPARDQLGSIFQDDAVRGLHRRPVVDHVRSHVPAIGSFAERSVDRVSGTHIREGSGPTIRHQDGRVPM
jgi:hypothetical protein